MSSEEARQQAQAEGLTLLVSENKTGFSCVSLQPGRSKPYLAQVRRGGKQRALGMFPTAEEAALCIARSPEGQAVAAERAAAAPPMTSEEARQQAQAEGLRLRVADNSMGYFGVAHRPASKLKPYEAGVWRGGKNASLGYFATAEEAALCVARSPEGRAAAGRAAAAGSQGVTPAMAPPGAEPVVKVEALLQLLDDDLDLDECIGRHGRDDALLVNEEDDSEVVRPKRQRMK